ncbi:unnamed protein product [Paramecium sonneborni]|uniref:Uncharacterized protein n=1 Tax=Paramecium sonneborni TaxID=65129 RepID=A0A8S1MUU3_9CILI|nr:unnamed protein product [Paramecium sonneborni]
MSCQNEQSTSNGMIITQLQIINNNFGQQLSNLQNEFKQKQSKGCFKTILNHQNK